MSESIEHEAPQETTSSPSPEPDEPQAGHAVIPEVSDTLAPPAPAAPDPLEPAEPGIYWCEAEDPGIHPVLGQIKQGENDWSDVTHPDMLLAIAALVDAGVLKKAEA